MNSSENSILKDTRVTTTTWSFSKVMSYLKAKSFLNVKVHKHKIQSHLIFKQTSNVSENHQLCIKGKIDYLSIFCLSYLSTKKKKDLYNV